MRVCAEGRREEAGERWVGVEGGGGGGEGAGGRLLGVVVLEGGLGGSPGWGKTVGGVPGGVPGGREGQGEEGTGLRQPSHGIIKLILEVQKSLGLPIGI